MPIFSRLATALVAVACAASGATVNLLGAGATFPEPLYLKWFHTFAERHPEIAVDYAAIGSGAGVERLKSGTADFAASDVPLSAAQLAAFGQPLLQLPSVAGAVAPIYNLPRVGRDVRFTPEVLANIYLGRITRWNDPAIKAANRDVPLPDQAIVVIHRRDSSGTTFIWTDYLAKASAEWKARVGAGTTVDWPVGVGADQNKGVAAAVEGAPWSIGYVEWIYAVQSHLSFGSVRNAAGKFVAATLESIAARDGPGAYPISSFTYLLIPAAEKDAGKSAALRELLGWVFTSGQNQAAGLGYVALPTDMAARAAKAIEKIR